MSITVKQLIDKLSKLPLDTIVICDMQGDKYTIEDCKIDFWMNQYVATSNESGRVYVTEEQYVDKRDKIIYKSCNVALIGILPTCE